MTPTYERVLIVGAGDGLSAAIARALHGAGLRIGLAARNTAKLAGLADNLGAATHPCDASDPKQVAALFSAMDEALGGAPDVVGQPPPSGCSSDVDVCRGCPALVMPQRLPERPVRPSNARPAARQVG